MEDVDPPGVEDVTKIWLIMPFTAICWINIMDGVGTQRSIRTNRMAMSMIGSPNHAKASNILPSNKLIMKH